MPILSTGGSTNGTITPAQARMIAAAASQQASQLPPPPGPPTALNGTSLPGQVSGSDWFDGPDWRGFLWTPQNPRGHSGNDIGMPLGTPLTALIPGTVISLGMEPWGGQINLQSQYPGIGPIVVSYLHLTSFARGMQAGVAVSPGQLIGYSGQPPPGGIYGSGAHTHFETNTGYQPPYMGHAGPPSPIDSLFLIQAARNGTLGQVGGGGFLGSSQAGSLGTFTGTQTDAASGNGPTLIGNMATWLGLPSFSLGTGAISRAPLSPGFLGVVENIDEIMEFPAFNTDNVLGWGIASGEAFSARLAIVVLGLIVVIAALWAGSQPLRQQMEQVAGPLVSAAATGAL